MASPTQLNLFEVYRYQCVNSRGTVAELEATCGGLVIADAPVSLEGSGGILQPCLMMHGKAQRHWRQYRAGAAVSVI